MDALFDGSIMISGRPRSPICLAVDQ
jgi:hypothetical protein